LLNTAIIGRLPIDSDTPAWVAGIGDDLAAKLAAVGLIPERTRAVLGGFLDDDIRAASGFGRRRKMRCSSGAVSV
jgi:hypothetical protein